MARKIKRGFLIKRYYCGKCNSRVSKDEQLCQNCGAPLEAVSPEPKQKPVKKPKPKPVVEEPIEEPDEFQEGPAAEFPEEEYYEGPVEVPQQKHGFALPPFKTVLWVLVAGMVLWGLFASDTLLIVAAALVIIIVELESIRRRLRS